jgi:hypothetical protein
MRWLRVFLAQAATFAPAQLVQLTGAQASQGQQFDPHLTASILILSPTRGQVFCKMALKLAVFAETRLPWKKPR